MCGIAGLIKFENTVCPAATLQEMRDIVSYRGPDDLGSLYFRRDGRIQETIDAQDSDWILALGHRRLSILDLSPSGHQPMCYENRYWIVYNGEVYNYLELRQELIRAGRVFHTSSDTEVILAAFATWGTACFSRFRGMWGLILFDALKRELILCRDRLGIKPLYVWVGNGLVAVASEIKQFLRVPGFLPRLDPVVGMEYLRTGYEDPERTFFEGVQPVPTAHWLRIPLDTCIPSSPEKYWFPEQKRISVSDRREAALLFADKLRECVRIHLRSDVPLGCALSGGLDSSGIAVIIDAQKGGDGHPLRTFTATFPGDAVDESNYADAIVSAIGAEAYKVTPQPERFLQDLKRFVWIHDEPVGSLSMYAGYCIARLTRESDVTVTLHGQGGDEILAGYWQSYFLHLYKLWQKSDWPNLARHFIGALYRNGNPLLWQQLPVMMRRYLSRKASKNGAEQRGRNALKEIMSLDDHAARVYQITTMFLPRLLKWDDRNSMAFSVEARYPFLDHELIDLCLSFAPDALYQRGWTKVPLRLGLERELPPRVRSRRTKFGFETPQNRWLCGPLRHTVESSFNQDRPIWSYVRPEKIRHLAEQVWTSGGSSEEESQALFRAFIFDRWLEVFSLDVRQSGLSPAENVGAMHR